MSKHTPGPWLYVPSTDRHGPYVSNEWGYGDICDCYAMSSDSPLYKQPSRPMPYQHDEADANARLISAAPDLLSELEDAVAFMKEKMAQYGDGGVSILIRAADAAIAKATGEPK